MQPAVYGVEQFLHTVTSESAFWEHEEGGTTKYFPFPHVVRQAVHWRLVDQVHGVDW